MVYLGYTTLAEQLSVDLGVIVIGLKNLYNKNIMIKKGLSFGIKIAATKEGRKMAKEAFRKAFKKHKAEVKRSKKVGTPVVPYNLVKSDIKRKIKGTKLTTAVEIKAKPGLRRRFISRIERAKRNRTPGGRPQIFGKAYASDKRGKSMNITLPKKQREAIQEDISQSVRKFMKERIGRKAQGGVVVNKMLVGGLLTKGIKYGYKQYRKAGGRSIIEIMRSGIKGAGKRSDAKTDVKFGIRMHGGRKLTKRDRNRLR